MSGKKIIHVQKLQTTADRIATYSQLENASPNLEDLFSIFAPIFLPVIELAVSRFSPP
jgi:hypothetical protein